MPSLTDYLPFHPQIPYRILNTVAFHYRAHGTVLPVQLNNAIAFHRLQGTAEVAGFPPAQGSQFLQGFRLVFLNHFQQAHVIVTQYLTQGFHGTEPDFWLFLRRFVAPSSNIQQTLLELFTGHDTNVQKETCWYDDGGQACAKQAGCGEIAGWKGTDAAYAPAYQQKSAGEGNHADA